MVEEKHEGEADSTLPLGKHSLDDTISIPFHSFPFDCSMIEGS